MSLYGAAFIASLFISLLIIFDAACLSASYSGLLYSQELYNNIVGAETMKAMAINTMYNLRSTSNLSGLPPELKSSIEIDGFSVQQFNSTLLIESDVGPRVYSTVNLGP